MESHVKIQAEEIAEFTYENLLQMGEDGLDSTAIINGTSMGFSMWFAAVIDEYDPKHMDEQVMMITRTFVDHILECLRQRLLDKAKRDAK